MHPRDHQGEIAEKLQENKTHLYAPKVSASQHKPAKQRDENLRRILFQKGLQHV